MEFKIGEWVRDITTDFKGVVIGRTEYEHPLYGTLQKVGVRACYDGNPMCTNWVEETKVEPWRDEDRALRLGLN